MLKKKLLRKGTALLLAVVLAVSVCVNSALAAEAIVPDDAAPAYGGDIAPPGTDDALGKDEVKGSIYIPDGDVQPTTAGETPPAAGANSAQPNTAGTTEGEGQGVYKNVSLGEPEIILGTPEYTSSVELPRLDAPGTRTDTIPVTIVPTDSTTPLTPEKPKDNTSPDPETDIDENSPYSPKIKFGTGSGLFARWGTSELANEYYLVPGDTVTISTANEPEGSKVYFTGSNSAIEAYKADPAFDFTAENSGWSEYADSVTIRFSDNYARVGAVMTDASGKAIKGTFISTNFWELDCERRIGVYGSADNYNLRMTDYLNLSGATATNITQSYYINAAVNCEAADPTETDYDFKLSDSEPGYLNDILGDLTGNTALNYKGVCVYYKNGEAVYTSPVLSDTFNFELTPMLVFSNEYDETDVLYYPCRLSARVIYGGNYDTVYYGIGKIGSTTSTEGWSKAGESFEVSGDINADDVALYAVLYDSKNNAGYTGSDGSFVIFEKPLIRVGDTTISGGGDTSPAEITLESTGVPQNFSSDIYYTLDGSDPANNGTLYTGPISTANYAKGDVVTVRAYTQLSNGDKSIDGEIAERNITVTDTAPVISYANGTVTLSNEGGTMYYTLDGSDPKSSETRKKYTAPFSLGGLNKLVRAVTYSDGSYSAVSETYADGGAYDLGTVTVPYSNFSQPVEFYTSHLNDDQGGYSENDQEFTFMITEPGVVSFDMFYKNIDESGYSGYYIYLPDLRDAEGNSVYTFNYYDVDEYRHYYRNEVLTAGTYSIIIQSDWDEVFDVKLKNLRVDPSDKVFFRGAYRDMGEMNIYDRGYSLYLDRLDPDSVVYYNITTDGSEPDAPTLSSAVNDSNYSIIYVGKEKPVVRVKAAVYNAETGTLGRVYSGYFVYVGAFDIFAVDGSGNRTSVGWDTLDSTSYDVIYDKTGTLYINDPAFEDIFPGGVDEVHYYYTVNDGTSIFNRDGTVYERAHEYTPGQVTLADLAQAADKDDYHMSWGFEVRAGAKVTSGGKTYYFTSDNRGYLYSMPAQPVITVNGSTITLSTQSESAKLYYSTQYNVYFGDAQRNYTEYTGPIEFDRNLIFTPVAVWESSKTYNGMQNGFSTTGRQFIPSTVIKSYAFEEAPAPGRESVEYYVPISVENPQSVDITVPENQKYYFHYMRTIRDTTYFDSECEAYIELQKLVNGSYVTVNNNFFNIPYNNGIWYDSGPFLTSGSWRLTFKAVPGSAAGEKALVYILVHCDNNDGDFSYPRLGGLVVTPRIDGMMIDVNNITIPQTTIDELYTYITVNKGKTIEQITGSATATEADAKAVIRAYLEDNSNYDRVTVWRRARNSGSWKGVRDIKAGDNWVYLDPSDDMEANTEYTYVAEIYPRSEWGKWTQDVFDRHGNVGWYRTELSSPLYVLPEDDEDPVITDFYFLQAGDKVVDNISRACTIFTEATDNQRVKYYDLEYKLSSDGDDKYKSIHRNTDVRTKSYSTYKTLHWEDLVPGNEYTFRVTVKDANGNTSVETFTAYCEELPAPTDFTVTKASSSVIINWTPQKGYAYRFEFYTEDNKYIRGVGDYRYDSTSAENGNVRVYIDPVKYPTFFIRQRQWAVDQYDIELAYVEKHNLSDGADTEAPVIRNMWPYNSSNGGYGNRYSTVRAWDDNRLYSLQVGYFTRSGEEGSYVYTPAEGFPAVRTYYYPTVDVEFNRERDFCTDYSLKGIAPGTYFYGVRVTDTSGNTSEWSYKQFSVSEGDTKRTPMPPLNVTAGSDRFYIEFTPSFDEETREQICDAFIPYWSSMNLTEEMMNDFLDHILDYSKVEYYYCRSDSGSTVNITDKIVNGEFTYVFSYGDKTPVAGNIDSGSWPYPDRYYIFYARLVKDDSVPMENWQKDIFDGSDVVWVYTLSAPAIKLLDDAEAPEISDIINTSGSVNVDNSSVISVNVTDDQLLKDIVIEYRVNGGSLLTADSDSYYHNGAYKRVNYESDRISSVTASINISWLRYNNDGDHNTNYRGTDLQNGDTIEIFAYAVDNKDNKSVVKTVTYTYVKIEAPTGLSVTPGNAGATVSWNKVELPEGVLDGTPEYGYRVYAYKASDDREFSVTDVAPGVTSADIPLDAVKYTGKYYFKVRVLTSTGGLGDATDKSANITPLADVTAPTGSFLAKDTTTLAGTNTDGNIKFRINARDNNYIKTLRVNVVDAEGNVYATWLYDVTDGDSPYWRYRRSWQDGKIGELFD